MGFDSRHRDNISAGEDLAEELAQTHRLELAHARDVLHRAEHAAGEDPQARSVRQWFALLVDEAAPGAQATGKQTELEASLDDRPTRPSPPPSRGKPAPGRETLVMREAHLEDAPSPGDMQRPDAAKRAPRLLDVGQEWRMSQALGFDFSGVSLRRDPPAAGRRRRAGDDERGGGARRPEIARIRAAMDSLRGGGAPLPHDLRRDYGALLGLDLSGVQIHENHGGASALGAQAFTHGSNIAVAPGLDPRSGLGRHVVAHELIHVGQNMKAGARSATPRSTGAAMAFAARLEVGPSDSAIEQEAEDGATALASGRPFSIGSHGALPGISLRGPTPEPPAPPTPNPNPTSNPTAPNPANPALNQPNPANPALNQPNPTPNQPSPTPGPATNPTPNPTPGPTPTTPTTPNPNATPTGATPAPNPTQDPAQTPTPVPTRGPTPTPTLDERVKQALEERADPALKAGYGKACAQIDILRINAVQYTFQPTGIGSVLLQSVWPWEALKEHGRQVSLTNPYPDGSLQAWIEGARGVIRILGDIAAWVATIADIVAAVSGLLALITSETVIGGLAFGAIAVIAAEVGTIAGLIKIMLDLIDALISVVQMLILIDKIKQSKDPNERAKMAALLQRECKEFAGTMTGVVVQLGTIVLTAGLAAGVGAAFAKSLKGVGRTFLKELGAEFRPLLNARKSINIIKEAATPKAPLPTRVTGDAATITPEELTGGAVVLQRIETRRVLVKSKLSRAKRKGKPRQWREIVTVTETKILRPQDLPKKVPKGDKAVKRELRYVIDPNKIRHGITIQVFHDPVKDGSAIPAGQVGGNAQADVKKPGDPTSPPPGGTPPRPEDRPGAAPLTQVAMWPSMLEQLQATKAPLAPANDRLMTQYNLAKDQAGTYHTGQVEKALGGAKNNAGQMRFSALQKQSDATEGAANTQQGATTAGGGKDKKTQLDANASKTESSVAKMGGQKVEKPQPKPGNWFDQAKQWLYDNTIGQIGALAASLQQWISDSVGGWAMAKAGLTKEELDLAGIEDSMRADNLKDKKTAEEMKAAKEDAAKIDPAVAELMKTASKDEQLAIQAMVEAQEFMTALDEADRTLDEAITEGTAYIAAVTPIIRHEMETKTEGKAIDAAYVAPVVSGATGFKTAAGGTEELAGPPAVDANGELEAARTMWPELNIGPGVAQIATAKATFVANHGAAVTAARAAADAAIASVNGLVGSTDYAGVTAAARTLEAAMNAFTTAEERAADAYVAALDQIIQAHVDLINSAIEAQEVPVDLDGDGVADEATPPTEPGPR